LAGTGLRSTACCISRRNSAHRFGYYDQMHMVHDFSRFTGETPTRTLQHFKAAFERQMTTIRSGHATPSEGDRWVL
jgi:hypothetical protein